MLLSRRKFAKHVNLSHTRINKLVTDGVIPLHDGKIELNEGIRLMKDNQDPSRDSQREANATRRKDAGVFAHENLPEHSLADMDDEERAEYNRQLAEEQVQMSAARDEAKAAGADVGMGKMPNSINKVKIFRELYLGKIAQLDFKKKSGEVVDKSAVDKDGYEPGRLIRDNLLKLPHKMSLKVAGLSKPKEIELVLENEIQEILEQISHA